MIEMKMRVYDPIDPCIIPDLLHYRQAGAGVDDRLYTIRNQQRIAEGKPSLVLPPDDLDLSEMTVVHDANSNVSLAASCHIVDLR